MRLSNLTFDQLTIGEQRQWTRTFSERDLYLFAATSGDCNPVHLDSDYAASTEFGERIAHGMWSGALISAAIATTLPGPGSIYRSQSIKFVAPVTVGDVLTVTLTVSALKPRVRLVTLDCVVSNQDGKTVAKGEAEVIAPSEPLSLDAPELPSISIATD